jgi:copper chaperone CopZ
MAQDSHHDIRQVHHVPGRLRLRIAAVKRNPGRAKVVEDLIEGRPGITSVDANTLTGSVTVIYDTDAITPTEILGILRDRGFVVAGGTEVAQVGGPDPDAAITTEVGDFLAKILVGAVLEKVVERSALALIAALV